MTNVIEKVVQLGDLCCIFDSTINDKIKPSKQTMNWFITHSFHNNTAENFADLLAKRAVKENSYEYEFSLALELGIEQLFDKCYSELKSNV